MRGPYQRFGRKMLAVRGSKLMGLRIALDGFLSAGSVELPTAGWRTRVGKWPKSWPWSVSLNSQLDLLLVL